MDHVLSEEKKVGRIMKVKTVGYYKEMPHADNTTDSIFDHIKKEDDNRVENICGYLESGIEFIVSPGMVDDVINPEKGPAGITSTYTDGKWFWPGDLAYYVRHYRLKLPDSFIDTMRNSGWKVSITMDDLDFDEIEVDGVKMFE